jgi:hypothetical protein
MKILSTPLLAARFDPRQASLFGVPHEEELKDQAPKERKVDGNR